MKWVATLLLVVNLGAFGKSPHTKKAFWRRQTVPLTVGSLALATGRILLQPLRLSIYDLQSQLFSKNQEEVTAESYTHDLFFAPSSSSKALVAKYRLKF